MQIFLFCTLYIIIKSSKRFFLPFLHQIPKKFSSLRWKVRRIVAMMSFEERRSPRHARHHYRLVKLAHAFLGQA